MKYILFALILLSTGAKAQSGWIFDTKTKGKFFTQSNAAIRKCEWTGKVVAGYLTGKGILKVYEEDALFYTYDGTLKAGVLEGQGKIIFQDGQTEEGFFKNGNLEGNGTKVYLNGSKYVGRFKNGLKEGQGSLYYDSGSKYIGEFKNDKFNGQGSYYDSGGEVETGYWVDGKLVKGDNRSVIRFKQIKGWEKDGTSGDFVNQKARYEIYSNGELFITVWFTLMIDDSDDDNIRWASIINTEVIERISFRKGSWGMDTFITTSLRKYVKDFLDVKPLPLVFE